MHVSSKCSCENPLSAHLTEMSIVRTHRSPNRMRCENKGSGGLRLRFAHVQRVISRGIVFARNTGRFENRTRSFPCLTYFVVEYLLAAKIICKNLFLGAKAIQKKFYDLFRDSADVKLKGSMRVIP